MADEKIKIGVELDAEPSLAGLRQLKKELRELSVTDPKFAEKQQQLDDYADALKSAKTGAGNFADILGSLPGPLGNIGGQLSGTITTLKQFSALKLNNLQSSFTELGKDLVDIAKGFANLTGLTKVYTVLNNALAASFIKVGIAEETAAVGARALSAALIATGIGALVVVLGLAASALYEMATGEKQAAAAADILNKALERQNELLELNAKDTARRNKIELAQLKAQGASAKEIRDLQYKQAKESYEQAFKDEQEAVKLYNDNLGKVDAEGLKKLEQNLTKRQQATKDAYANAKEIGLNNAADELKEQQSAAEKRAAAKKVTDDKAAADQKQKDAEKKKAIEDAGRAETDAYKELLSDREKELYEAGVVANQRILDIDKAGVGDRNIVLEAFRKKQAEINAKYDKEDEDKKKEQDEKDKERLLKKQADERGIALTGLQSQFEDLERQNQLNDIDFEQDLQRLAEQRNIIAEQERIELENTELSEFERTEIRKKYADARKDIAQQEVETEKAAQQAKVALQLEYIDLFQQFGNLLGQIAGKNKTLAIAGLLIEKGAAVAKIITQMMSIPPILPPAIPNPAYIPSRIAGALSIASVLAATATGVQQINQAAASAGATGGGSIGTGGGAPAIPPPTLPTIAAPQIQTGGGMNPTTQIAQTISGAQQPIRAYVVSGEISSQQALDRRTNRAATFVGG